MGMKICVCLRRLLGIGTVPMTHAYDRNNNHVKRGPRWLLLHCALCGDLLPRYRVECVPAPPVCTCTDQLQRSRRLAREHQAKQTAVDAERAARAPVTRPNYSDSVTKLGA